MLAPLLLQPRAADIVDTDMATNVHVWVEETPLTLTTWVDET